MISKNLLISLCFLLQLATLSLSTPIKLAGTTPYEPVDYCDLNDPLNSSIMRGSQWPIKTYIINQTIMKNYTQFVCVEPSIVDASFNVSSGGKYYPNLDFLFLYPMNSQNFTFSQNPQVINLIAMTYYKEPDWLFFNLFSPSIFIFLIGIIIILGELLQPIQRNVPGYYQASEYIGLLFFQPEIHGSRTLSRKILSLGICTTSLIVMTYFISSLNKAEYNLQYPGGTNFDNGLYRQKVYLEQPFVFQFLGSLIIPQSIPLQFNYQNWKKILMENPEKLFIVNTVSPILEVIDCNFRSFGVFSSIFFTVLFQRLTREEILSLNIAILDWNLYSKDYSITVSIFDAISPEEAKCENQRPLGKYIRYILKDFKELWYIYLAGIGLAIVGYIFRLIKICIYHQRNVVLLEGFRAQGDMDCALQIKNLFRIDLNFLYRYQVLFLFPVLIERLKKIRNGGIKRKVWTAEKLAAVRSKVVRNFIKIWKIRQIWGLKRRFFLKYFTGELVKDKKKSSIIIKNFKNYLHNRRTKHMKSLYEFIDEALLICFIKGLNINCFTNFYYKGLIQEYEKKTFFAGGNKKIKLDLHSTPFYNVSPTSYYSLLFKYEEKIASFLMLKFANEGTHKAIRNRPNKTTNKLSQLLLFSKNSNRKEVVTKMISYLHNKCASVKKARTLIQLPNLPSPKVINNPKAFPSTCFQKYIKPLEPVEEEEKKSYSDENQFKQAEASEQWEKNRKYQWSIIITNIVVLICFIFKKLKFFFLLNDVNKKKNSPLFVNTNKIVKYIVKQFIKKCMHGTCLYNRSQQTNTKQIDSIKCYYNLLIAINQQLHNSRNKIKQNAKICMRQLTVQSNKFRRFLYNYNNNMVYIQ